ncbi:MAG: hypothetical protein KME07_08945 [Pegethrix bostrychoides GSE-TBD4-15B]|jgi:hypothetical protein|uniref:Uncharacterized protein n=1 Tax=Pegethrix bostrychoides GSE-TBD4-15B TaxID=2839662 RepID=A0A951U4B8_9CYAN|nr:hypothetical protein [Pegethrix bostrychoides GSE-TBD4-15B]
MKNLNTNDFPSYEELLTWCVYAGSLDGEFSYPKSIRSYAKSRVKLFYELSSPVKERFVHWWKTREIIDDLEVKGYTLQYMANKYPHKIPIAFIYFDDLLQNPDNYFSLKYCHQTYGLPLSRDKAS